MTEILDLRNNNLDYIDFEEYNNYNVFHLENNNLNNIIIDNQPNITNLYLSNNNLTGTIVLRNLENLIIVMLNSNDLNRVVIEDCPKLMFINVCNNKNLDDVNIYECPSIQCIDRSQNHLLPSIEDLLSKLDANNLQELKVNTNNIKFCYNENYELSLIVIKDLISEESETFKISKDKIETKKFNNFRIVHDYDDEFKIMYEDMQVIKFNKTPLGNWRVFRFIK